MLSLQGVWLCSMAKNLQKKEEVKIHFFFFASNMDIHVPVPCTEKIILSLQKWKNLSLSTPYPNFPP